MAETYINGQAELDGFIKVETPLLCGKRIEGIVLNEKNKCLSIGADVIKACGFWNGETLSLYRKGNTFRLVHDDYGKLTMRKMSTGATYRITSRTMWYEIAPALRGKEIATICDNGMVTFGAK